MRVCTLIILIFLLLTSVEGAFNSYLKKLLRAGTTPTANRKGRPVDQGGEATGEAPSGTTIPGGTHPPATGGPQETTAPPQRSSGVPRSPEPTSSLWSTTPAVSTTIRCTVGVWSEWREDMSCNANCGACGTVVRRRTCTTAAAGCPCDGAFRESRPCRISACPYPQPSCCPPFNLIYVNGTFACGPQNDTVMAEYLKEIGLRASTTTRAPTRTTTTLSGTQPAGSTPAPTGGPQPTGPPGTEPTGAPGTTGEPDPSTGAPGERTTEAGGVETTAAGVEDEMDARPWYHRLKPMQKRPIIGEEVEVTTEEGAETTTEEGS